MLSENGIHKLLGSKVHNALEGSVKVDEQVMNRIATCKRCGSQLTSFFNEDEDRYGWSAWKGDKSCE